MLSTLDHEVLDDPVELCAVVVSSSDQLCKVPAGVRCMLPVKLYLKLAHPVKEELQCRIEDCSVARPT